jgi:glycosyltransferase involved in cell wall biosynthesis
MRISLVLTTYNAAWCIERALDSVFGGAALPDEVILGDDGSEDDTLARVERRYGSRVRVLRFRHRGLTASRRDGLAAAGGDWLALMDADDTWRPAKLERQRAFLAAHPEVRWCGTDGAVVSAEGVVRPSWFAAYFRPVTDMVGDLLPPLAERCFPLVSSMLIERRAYEESGGFDERFRWSQDYDLWLRLAARWPGGMIGEPLTTYWTGPGQLSSRIEERYRDDLALVERIARGELRDDPVLRRIGAGRAAALQYDLAIRCLRDGRHPEARERLRRARGAGPWGRRALAAAAGALPASWLARLAGSPWLKRAAAAARRTVTPVDADAASGRWS